MCVYIIIFISVNYFQSECRDNFNKKAEIRNFQVFIAYVPKWGYNSDSACTRPISPANHEIRIPRTGQS